MAKSFGIELEVAKKHEAWTPRNFLRKCYERSPWLTIAVMLHVLLFAMLAIVRPDRPEARMPINVAFVASPLVDADMPEQLPEDFDRTVPPATDELESPVNPDPNYTVQIEPGRISESTDEADPSKDPGAYNPDPEAASDKPSGPLGATSIGVGAKGHLGFPSPYSGRIPGGGGKGDGGSGHKGHNSTGSSLKTEDAVNNALIWLRNHQSPDGHWDCARFSERCKGVPCDGRGQSVHDVGVTGLALLCFLGAGCTQEEGYYKQTVLNGLKYLMAHQDVDGCFGDKIGQHFLYDHACAALAMSEAFGMTKARAFQRPAQQGISFIMRAQNPYSAWRYNFPPDGDNDTSVTGWMVMALKSAKMSELITDEESFKNALNFITEMTDPGTGRTGYTERGSASSRLTEMTTRFPPERSEALTAVGMLVRIFADQDSSKDELITKGADLLAQKVPIWEVSTGGIDFYYWYYATLAMFQVGGPRWTKWNEALKTACIEHQHTNKDECSFGSWDAIDPWSGAGGRVYSTAMNCLCMEVYYRYPQVFGMPGKKH